MITALQQNDYALSNRLKLPTVSICKTTKNLYHFCRDKETGSLTTVDIKELLNRICSDFGINPIAVYLEGIQPHKCNKKGKIKRKTMGMFKRDCFSSYIEIYKYTAKRKQIYSSKSVVSTLLHEITHYFDYSLLGLSSSPHTAGFYKRISQLEGMLK